MAGPLTLKASTYPATSTTLEGVRELTSSEIRDRIANVITTKFATDTDGSGIAELKVTTGSLETNYTNVGTFTNRERTEAVGTHPAAGSTTETVYQFEQKSSPTSAGTYSTPLRWNGTALAEMSSTQIEDEILDEVITAMVTEDANTIGQYKIGTTTPSGGTWTARYTITETQVDGTDVNYYLYQKTGATTVPSSTKDSLVKQTSGNTITEMTDTELQAFSDHFRKRIIDSGVGTYLLNNGTPSETGTWVQMGTTMTDQLKSVTDVTYAGSYTGYSEVVYTGSYAGYFNRFYGGYLNGAYAGSFTGYYTGYYSAEYAGNYTGATVQSTSTTQETKQLFVRTA